MRINLEFVEDDELRDGLLRNLDELQALTEQVLASAKGAGGAVFAGTLALASGSAWADNHLPVKDPLRVVKIAKGQPILVAFFTVLSGPDVGQGLDPYRGAQLAAEDIGGKLLGHPIRFTAEDDGCNAEGGQTAGTKIAANQQVVVALGSNCSSATIPAVMGLV